VLKSEDGELIAGTPARVGMRAPPSVLRPASMDALASKHELDQAGVQLFPAAVFTHGRRFGGPGGV